MEKTYLDVPNAHREYAARFGAVYDQSAGRYFVVGEVSSELYGYVPKEPRHRNYVNEVGQQCAVCGAAMEIRERRSDRSLYYRCVSCLSMSPA